MTPPGPSLARRLLSGGSWALSGRVVSSGSNLAISILVARMLPPVEAGVYFLAFSVAAALAVLARGGLEKTVLRLVAEHRAAREQHQIYSALVRVYAISLIFVALTASGTALMGPVVAQGLFELPRLAQIVPLVAWWVAYLAYEMLLAETFRGLDSIPLASVFGGAAGRLLTVIALGGLSATGGAALETVVAVTVIAGVVALIPGSIILARRALALKGREPARVRTATVLGITAPLLVTNLAFFTSRNADLWILGAFRPAEELAIYAVAVRLVLLVGAALSIVDAVLPPLIAELTGPHQRERLQDLARSTASVAGLPAAAVLLIFIVAGRPVLELAFGPYYGASYPVLAILSFGQCANVFAGSCGYVLIMTGHQRSLMRAALGGGVLSVIGGLLLAGRFGALGVAVAAASGVVFQNLLILWMVRQHCGIWTHVGWRPLTNALVRLTKRSAR